MVADKAKMETNEGIVKTNPSEEKYDLDSLSDIEKGVYKKVNASVAKFDVEVENFRFNTAVAALMELLNELNKSLDSCSNDLVTFSLDK